MTRDTDERGKLLPCPFCGSEIKHIESWARSFDPPRLYHEWHHVTDNVYACPVRRHIGKIVASATDDVKMQETRIARWNTRAPAGHAEREALAWRYELAHARIWNADETPGGWTDWRWHLNDTKPNAGDAMRNLTPLYALSNAPAPSEATFKSEQGKV